MLPANRVRDSRGVGEFDFEKTHTKVYLPSHRGAFVLALVRISSGDCYNGTGIVEDKVNSPLGMGTQIRFSGGTLSGVRPKFIARLHRKNEKETLLKAVTDQLVSDMQMKVTVNSGDGRTRQPYVSAHTIQRNSGNGYSD